MLNPGAELEDEVHNYLTNRSHNHTFVSDMSDRSDIEKCGQDIDELLGDVA